MTSAPSDPSQTQAPHTTEKPPALINLYVRVLTALVLLPIILAGAFYGSWPLAFMIGIIAVIGVLEFYVLEQGRQVQGSALIGGPMAAAIVAAFYFKENAIWIAAILVGAAATFILETVRHPRDMRRSLWQTATTLAGVLYVAFPAAFLLVIRALPDGIVWLLALFGSTWGTDTFAFLGGRMFGKTPLAPHISPKKTVEGAIVGVLGGMGCAAVILLARDKLSGTTLILIALAPLVATAGDLFESAIKRFFHVKDSHIQGLNIFPGHGGVLDRIDALIWVSTLFYVFLMLTGVAG